MNRGWKKLLFESGKSDNNAARLLMKFEQWKEQEMKWDFLGSPSYENLNLKSFE